MTSWVIIKIRVPKSHEIPNGEYYERTYRIVDSQWANMRSAVSQLEAELLHYGGDL